MGLHCLEQPYIRFSETAFALVFTNDKFFYKNEIYFQVMEITVQHGNKESCRIDAEFRANQECLDRTIVELLPYRLGGRRYFTSATPALMHA